VSPWRLFKDLGLVPVSHCSPCTGLTGDLSRRGGSPALRWAHGRKGRRREGQAGEGQPEGRTEHSSDQGGTNNEQDHHWAIKLTKIKVSLM
jgi:hypothetical protein